MAAAVLTSCNMDEAPDGSIDINNACTKMADVHSLRNGLYSFLRGRSGGGYTTLSDLQTDLFIATRNSGNSYLEFLTGQLKTNNEDVEGIFYGLYSGLMQTNFFLEAVTEFKTAKEETLTAEDLATIDRDIAEAYFMRAYYNSLLVYYWCGNYDASTASKPHTGIPLVVKYQPSQNRGTYPSRSTLEESYTQIEEDLKLAIEGLEAWEENDMSALVAGGNGYLNSYAAKALKARVALWKGTQASLLVAYNTAKEIIDSGEFPLTTRASYTGMWRNDAGSELIFQPYGDASQRGSVTAYTMFNQGSPNNVLWTATANAYNKYTSDDIRLSAFFSTTSVKFSGASLTVLRFNKFPGKSTYNSGNYNEFKNLPKPFRTSEQYLILAEAGAALGKADASDYLNEFIGERVSNYTPQTLTGAALTTEIRDQWVKEFIGEGFRLGQLRRWNIASTRTSAYPASLSTMPGFIIDLGTNTYGYQPGAYQLVWPIPSAEMTTNPNLAGQQNPGY